MGGEGQRRIRQRHGGEGEERRRKGGRETRKAEAPSRVESASEGEDEAKIPKGHTRGDYGSPATAVHSGTQTLLRARTYCMRASAFSRRSASLPQPRTQAHTLLYTHTHASVHTHKCTHASVHTHTSAHTLACKNTHWKARTRNHTYTHT